MKRYKGLKLIVNKILSEYRKKQQNEKEKNQNSDEM